MSENTSKTKEPTLKHPPLNIPDTRGYYGRFGGAYIPEMLYPNVEELKQNYQKILGDAQFRSEFEQLLRDYVGRPTPLFLARNLSEMVGAKVYLKREDLCHTGAHKLNNVVGQALMARYLGKPRIIAETGAGQHGVATATVCALLRIPCTVFMGSKDMARQKPNVMRMHMLGAEVVPVESGSKSLKDATNEAIRYWINHPDDTYYLIGSTIGPHPYPDLVAQLQSVISEEISTQLLEKEGVDAPTHIVACAGGGSNAAGAFFHFIGNEKTRLIGAEAAGEGVDSDLTAATIAKGTPGIIHGCKTLLMQTADGQVQEAHSVSAGLDYPGIGPLHAFLHDTKLAEFIPVTDSEALEGVQTLTRAEGIIPALETAHAIAALFKLRLNSNDIVVVSLSGRGDKDLETYQNYFSQNDTKK
ncbi:MAG: tryptophan synthase subunit beta [Bacteroidota bacterium]